MAAVTIGAQFFRFNPKTAEFAFLLSVLAAVNPHF
jgi:hypothetical protein